MGWICRCGHNKSLHRLEWNKFRGVWDTSCRDEQWGVTGRERCRCDAFTDENGATA